MYGKCVTQYGPADDRRFGACMPCSRGSTACSIGKKTAEDVIETPVRVEVNEDLEVTNLEPRQFTVEKNKIQDKDSSAVRADDSVGSVVTDCVAEQDPGQGGGRERVEDVQRQEQDPRSGVGKGVDGNVSVAGAGKGRCLGTQRSRGEEVGRQEQDSRQRTRICASKWDHFAVWSCCESGWVVEEQDPGQGRAGVVER